MADCVHHWRIATPSGATTLGVCKLCGDRKEFSSAGPDESSYHFQVRPKQLRKKKEPKR